MWRGAGGVRTAVRVCLVGDVVRRRGRRVRFNYISKEIWALRTRNSGIGQRHMRAGHGKQWPVLPMLRFINAHQHYPHSHYPHSYYLHSHYPHRHYPHSHYPHRHSPPPLHYAEAPDSGGGRLPYHESRRFLTFAVPAPTTGSPPGTPPRYIRAAALRQ